MLTTLSLDNFKSWSRIGDLRFAPITGLFGTNSSGKTSIFQILLLLKQTKDSSDRLQVLNFGNERTATNLGSYRDVLFLHEMDRYLQWKIGWKLDETIRFENPGKKGQIFASGDKISFSARVESTKRNILAVNKFSYEIGGSGFGMAAKSIEDSTYELKQTNAKVRFLRSPGRKWDLPAPVKCYGFPDQVRTYFQNAGFVSDLQLQFEQFCDRIHYLGPLREFPRREYIWSGGQPADMGQRGERVVDALLSSRERGITISRGQGVKRLSVEEYVAYWLRRLSLIHDFSVKPFVEGGNLYRVAVQRTAYGTEVDLTDVGFGVSQILPVLTLCYYVPEGSILILEQPEIHLHPSVQAGLADVFIDAIARKNVQIIVESHSEHLLRRLQRRIAEESISNDNVALYFCSMNESESQITELDIDLYGSIRNWPTDFFGDEFEEMAAIQEAAIRRRKAS